MELLNKEISLNEYSQSKEEVVEKAKDRCTFCRKKNHVAEYCYKKLEAERRSKTKAPETTVTCYGCQKPAYYKSNCPDCNNKLRKSSEKLDFNSMQSSVAAVGRNVPTVDINENGINRQAFFDTGARTSIAGYQLFTKLKEKGLEFEKVVAEITLADGIPRNEIVYSVIADIIIDIKSVNWGLEHMEHPIRTKFNI